MVKKLTVLLILIVIIATIYFLRYDNSASNSKQQTPENTSQNLPEIAVYPEAKLVSNKVTSSAEGNVYHIIWQTKDNLSTVAQWYLTTYTKSGWILDSSTDQNNTKMRALVLTKEEKYFECLLEKDTASGNTTITVNLMNIAEYGEED